MKELQEYLAKYIDHVCVDGVLPEDVSVLTEWFKQGLEAYQSTENCTIGIMGGDCPDCGEPMVRKNEELYDLDGNTIGFVAYVCPDCSYLVYG